MDEVTNQVAIDLQMPLPERLQNVNRWIDSREIAEIFGYTTVYVRRLRQKREELDELGHEEDVINALPKPLPGSRHPLYWDAASILRWGFQTGRLDPETGQPRRLRPPGRPRTTTVDQALPVTHE